MRAYADRRITPEQFSEDLQKLTDEYQIVVPLHYTPQRQYKESEAAHQPPYHHAQAVGAKRNAQSSPSARSTPRVASPAAAVIVSDDLVLQNAGAWVYVYVFCMLCVCDVHVHV